MMKDYGDDDGDDEDEDEDDDDDDVDDADDADAVGGCGGGGGGGPNCHDAIVLFAVMLQVGAVFFFPRQGWSRYCQGRDCSLCSVHDCSLQ